MKFAALVISIFISSGLSASQVRPPGLGFVAPQVS